MGIKGKPSLTVNQFCHWVNNDLPNKTLEPGFPRKISVETACKWMYELGCHKEEWKFVGHECDMLWNTKKGF